MDPLGAIFAFLTLIVFLCSGVFSFEYLKGSKNIKSYAVFYVITMAVELLLCAASNLITFYMCYELLTIMSMPLVIHERTAQSKAAALKYLFFSMFGAYFALFGIYNLSKKATSLSFVYGGNIDASVWVADEKILLISVMAMIIGFGVKAGMWPMHSWLPAAHPVAPSPASAVLSACVVKAGVLGIIRSIWYVAGTGKIPGSYVQKAWMILTLMTVFLGSMLAYREQVLKKRLAYSTVSQVSYILFGLAVGIGSVHTDSMVSSYAYVSDSITGAILHVLAHGFIKAVLFLVAGAAMRYMNVHKVDELKGIGLKMPGIMVCYTIASLGLIGIPPTGGFVSKWYLATGSIATGIPVFSWLGPVVLLVSALLTAGYLLGPAVKAFFPGREYRQDHKDDKPLGKDEKPGLLMLLPVATLTLLSVLMGIFTSPIIEVIRKIFFI
ncbi:MAG: proton-conducting membrane transporter [Lachnospiraceae bacterium]|nr:proton-conducting membrane transporter [Lachnospiraceae bacterium]